MRRFLLLLIALMLCCPWGSAEGISCRVDLEAEGTAVSPTLWGIFLEDINHAADGGLCAQMGRENRWRAALNPIAAHQTDDGGILPKLFADRAKLAHMPVMEGIIFGYDCVCAHKIL